VDPAPAAALPAITFEQGLSLWWNGEEIRVIHLPPGHTDGDAAVWFTKSNVVHLGDTFTPATDFPFVDRKSGGSAAGMVHALDAVLGWIPKDAKVIPGHGELSTVEELRKYRSDLGEMVEMVKKGLAGRKTVEQLQKAHVLAKWESKNIRRSAISADDFIATVAEDLQKK
jgi:glyoxylase-like metal-dependent hydrolase (beta-lactamase superfamily II)